MKKTAVIIGATGLTGRYLLQHLLEDEDFEAVRILVRKPVEIQHAKLHQELVNFDDLDGLTQKFGNGVVIFCCIGTTLKKVNGNLSLYRKVDFDIPVNAAKIGKANNFKKYLVISSVGANAKSKNFYLKLKGELENELKRFSYESISIFRPGQLLGKRNEERKREKFFQSATNLLSVFLFGSLKKYHSIKADDVAKAMIAESKIDKKGVSIIEYKEIKKLF
jgi:uncharacterized protein YbjT (DUF2867 family)